MESDGDYGDACELQGGIERRGAIDHREKIEGMSVGGMKAPKIQSYLGMGDKE